MLIIFLLVCVTALLAFVSRLSFLLLLIGFFSVCVAGRVGLIGRGEPIAALVYLFLGGVLCVLSFFCRFS